MSRQVVLDTETTGIDFKSGHRVIEIGCIEIINRKFTGSEFQTYLNPDREIEEGAIKVHGLTLDFLKDKPRFHNVADDFLKFIRDSELIIHNAEFDVGFLNNELKILGGECSLIEEVAKKITDTLQMAREKHPGQRNSLDALVQRYEVSGYDREHHGALLDSKILGDVYLAMTGGQSDLLFEKSSFNTLKEKDQEIKKNTYLKEKNTTNLVKLTKAEEKDNIDYLKKMRDETGVTPGWLKNNE